MPQQGSRLSRELDEERRKKVEEGRTTLSPDPAIETGNSLGVIV